MTKCFIALCFFLASSCAVANTVWIDVRSDKEYQADGIQSDRQIPHEVASEKILALYPDKNIEIVLYCRSGRRAGLVLETLKGAGYTNIRNAGGISDVREERNLTDKK